ncbi:MAG: hypothetical protein HC933_03060 [Pleurocapsa sp. SU_196_0]|nr:hypothetical protein [Pleurocapsa sp. SU_196_0]
MKLLPHLFGIAGVTVMALGTMLNIAAIILIGGLSLLAAAILERDPSRLETRLGAFRRTLRNDRAALEEDRTSAARLRELTNNLTGGRQ